MKVKFKSIHIQHGKGSLTTVEEVILAITEFARKENCNIVDTLSIFLRKVSTKASEKDFSSSPPLTEHSYPQYPKTYMPLINRL